MPAAKRRTSKKGTKKSHHSKKRVSGRLSTKTLNDLIKRLKVTSKVSRKHRHHHSKKSGSKKTHRASRKSSSKARKSTL